jgi:alkylation response protein AidB-like acyl-CoA dehydrogenase
MNFNLTNTPEEEAFRQEVRAFLEAEATDEIRRQHSTDKGLGPEGREFSLKLGEKGWLGLGLPEEYGGSGGSLKDEIIFIQELARHEVRVLTIVGRYLAGPTILRFGSEEMKKEFLPRIARGEIEFALGYTEPQAGSDLMAMQMRAVEEGDYFIINGTKIFNTGCHFADYHWLAVKTDPTGPRHQSISLFVVDMDAPGIEVRPLWTMGGERTNEVYYENVKVPKSRLVGELNQGFLYMVHAINYERLALFQMERFYPVIDRLVNYAKSTRRNGVLLADDPLFRNKLAQMAVEVEVCKCIEYKALALLLDGSIPDYEAGILKLVGSEFYQRLTYVGMELLSDFGLLEEGSEWAALNGEISRICRSAVPGTIGAGSSEIVRNITAMRALGMRRKKTV